MLATNLNNEGEGLESSVRLKGGVKESKEDEVS